MFFQKKNHDLTIEVYGKNLCLYRGKLQDLPIQESIIIEKSIHFFNDASPCFIHRSAVRVRLLAEIDSEIRTLLEPNTTFDSAQLPLLCFYMDCNPIHHVNVLTSPSLG